MRHQAELEFSQKKLERYAQLAKTDYVSKLNVEEFKRDVRIQEAQILADQAELQLAQLNLNECYVCAPVEGKVSLSTIDEGNLFIAYDQAILTQILQLSPVNVNFTLCQKDFQDLQPLLKKKGGRFEVILPYESQEKFEGEVTVIDNHINSETGTITLRGRVDNRDETLWPGQFVYVRFFVREKKGVPVIPQTAIQQGQKGTFVYVLQPDQTVEAVAIQTAEHFDDFVVVDQGLKPGMKIVTDGQLNLRSGVKVVVSAEIAQGQ
jgi:membrane fusion protein, multidrug efflux system